MTKEEQGFNPIDKDKTTENPGTLAYPHHVGSPAIKPVDRGKVKGRAMAAMVQQTDKQLSQLYKQMQLLADQANEIKNRIEVSELIYHAEMGFEPIVGKVYFLYEKTEGKYLLTLLSPDDWGSKLPYKRFVSAARLLADHTWDLEETDDPFNTNI